MTPNTLLVIASVVGLVSCLTAVLINWAFCVRNAPRWMRLWRDLALALGFTRLFLRSLEPHQPTPWWGALLWLHVALWCAMIAGYNIRHGLGPNGDRCEHER